MKCVHRMLRFADLFAVPCGQLSLEMSIYRMNERREQKGRGCMLKHVHMQVQSSHNSMSATCDTAIFGCVHYY